MTYQGKEVMKIIHAVPTNIITGFLGVGKTTAILSLLKQRPVTERWAVLVNEFGEVGLDGALIASEQSTGGVSIREVAGGCMCCLAGVPMQVGLQRLLSESKPDRLLIEPTGLGHPREVLAVLLQAQYQSVLDVKATITLIDPRKLNDERYTQHPVYKDQIDVADVLLANKSDLADEVALQRFYSLAARQKPEKKLVKAIAGGAIEPAWLDLPSRLALATKHSGPELRSMTDVTQVPPKEVSLPDGEDCIRYEKQADGYSSCGWLFSSAKPFIFNAIYASLSAVDAQRLKALLYTTEGWVSFNAVDGVMTSQKQSLSSPPADSRVELIYAQATDWSALEQALLQTRDI
jgi:G3E family GTPase